MSSPVPKRTASSPGRRVLSAIMFTDVVGFSSRMGENEALTGALVRRDLEFMTKRCTARHGRVIKSTGDGLLVVFDSVVEAVSAAIAIQQAIAEAAKRLPREQVLTHRIAVHMGDIIVTADNDVMGEGVNIAARLQELAEPGGVCISAGTYELVKNRLKLEGVFAGTCELKNISEPIGIYRLSLSGEAGGRPKRTNATAKQWWWRGALAAAVVAIFATLAVISGGGLASADRADAPPTPTPTPAPAVAGPSIAPAATPSIADVLPADGDFFVARAHFARRNDFGGLVKHLIDNPHLIPDPSNRQNVLERYTHLANGQANVMTYLQGHSSVAPLKIINGDSDAGNDWEVWADEAERVHIRDAQGQRTLAMHEVENVRAFQIALTLVANESARLKRPPSKDVVDTLRTLMKEYAIPESALPELLPASVRLPK